MLVEISRRCPEKAKIAHYNFNGVSGMIGEAIRSGTARHSPRRKSFFR